MPARIAGRGWPASIELNDSRPVLAGNFGGAIGGPIINHDDLTHLVLSTYR